jgi:hypothetical protein
VDGSLKQDMIDVILGEGRVNVTLCKLSIVPQSLIPLGTKFYDIYELPNQSQLQNAVVEQRGLVMYSQQCHIQKSHGILERLKVMQHFRS